MMATKLDDVIETVLRAREDGPESLAAVALSFGAAMELGTRGNAALNARLAEARDAMAAADKDIAAMQHERDAALAELKAARENAADTVEVWRLRESVAALRADIARVAAERDEARSIAAMRDRALTAAVQEREAFGLRLSAAERQRDEAHARPTYEARTTAPTPEECAAHRTHSGFWVITDADEEPKVRCLGAHTHPPDITGRTWLPLGADGLPCAWPVAAPEGGA